MDQSEAEKARRELLELEALRWVKNKRKRQLHLRVLESSCWRVGDRGGYVKVKAEWAGLGLLLGLA